MIIRKKIKDVKDNGALDLVRYSRLMTVFFYMYYYFNKNERISIILDCNEKLNFWNYIEIPLREQTVNNYISNNERDFYNAFFKIKYSIENKKRELKLQDIYTNNTKYRYNYVLKIISKEEKIFILKEKNIFIVNGDSEAIKTLDIFKNINFEEIDFYLFYVNYLSKKEYEDKKVLVGYNGIDGKEVTMLQLKEDINKIRDGR